MQEYNRFIIQIILVADIEIQRRFLYMSVEMMEHDEDLWTRFVSTGSVEDYLKYRT